MGGGTEIVQCLAVDDHPDVHPLATIDPRNGAQNRVLERLHRPAPGSQLSTAAARADRYSTYAGRSASGSQSSGTKATISVSNPSVTTGASSRAVAGTA